MTVFKERPNLDITNFAQEVPCIIYLDNLSYPNKNILYSVFTFI